MELPLSPPQLAELDAFFAAVKPVPGGIQLYPGTTIIDLPKFITSQLTILREGNSPTVQQPALNRVVKLREILSAGK